MQRLSQDDGVNLAGIKRIIDLEQATYELQQRLAETQVRLAEAEVRLTQLEALSYPRRDLVPTHPRQTTALVVWKPRTR